MSKEGATADIDSAKKYHKNVTLLITHRAPKDIYNMDKIALFCSVKLKRTLALKGKKGVEKGKGIRTK
jgi:hypothetical protein